MRANGRISTELSNGARCACVAAGGLAGALGFSAFALAAAETTAHAFGTTLGSTLATIVVAGLVGGALAHRYAERLLGHTARDAYRVGAGIALASFATAFGVFALPAVTTSMATVVAEPTTLESIAWTVVMPLAWFAAVVALLAIPTGLVGTVALASLRATARRYGRVERTSRATIRPSTQRR